MTGMVVTAAELKGRDLPLLREAGAHQTVSGTGDLRSACRRRCLSRSTQRASVNLVAPAGARCV